MENSGQSHSVIVIRCLILVMLIASLIFCLVLFLPRFLYQSGITQLKLQNYDLAIHYFKRAEKRLPKFLARTLAQADQFRIFTHQGQAFYHKGIQNWKENGPSANTSFLLQRGRVYLIKAHVISPLDYRNSFWLTHTEHALETLYHWQFPQKTNIYNADSFYKKALALRPAGSSILYSYIKYLNETRRISKLTDAVEKLMEIYPLAYFSIRKESFYSDHLANHMVKGLGTAIKNDVLSRYATEALSDIHVKAGDYSGGISFYQAYLAIEPSKNTSGDYLGLGKLYLMEEEVKRSHLVFKNALEKSENKSHTLKQIYGLFKNANFHQSFLVFLTQLGSQDIFQYDLGMAAAKCYIDMKDFNRAKAILTRIGRTWEKDQVFYLLAIIARKQKDWDGMELATQKASHLNPVNANYHYLFAESLANQEKYSQAESAVTEAIQNSTKENFWYYHYRASMLWAQKKYAPAVSDWEKAFTLKPDRSDFAYCLARGYQTLGHFDKALVSIQNALALAPANSKYEVFLKKLDPE